MSKITHLQAWQNHSSASMAVAIDQELKPKAQEKMPNKI